MYYRGAATNNSYWSWQWFNGAATTAAGAIGVSVELGIMARDRMAYPSQPPIIGGSFSLLPIFDQCPPLFAANNR